MTYKYTKHLRVFARTLSLQTTQNRILIYKHNALTSPISISGGRYH